MSVLIVENNYSQFLTENQQAKSVIWSAMRFRARNYFHSEAYRRRVWDGFTEFFDKNSGYFLTGLLPEVRLALKHMGIEYTVRDNRNSFKFLVDKVDEDWLNKHLQKGMKKVALRDYQIDYINQSIRNKRGIIFAPTSAGKAQPLTSLVYTPSGPKRMGEMKIGDVVCTPDGGKSKILHIFPQGEKDICRIHFSNGDTVECCEDHLWKIDAIMDNWRDRVKDTKYIESHITNPNGRPKYRIKKCDHINFDHRDVAIDGYFMGVLLGDGAFQKYWLGITSGDVCLVDKIRELLRDDYQLRQVDCYDYRIVKKKRKGQPLVNIYLEYLRNYGLNGKRSHEKFIPDCYKYNSVNVRRGVIVGLMDTDGYVDDKGRLEYGSSSKQLALDFKEVFESLGGTCHWREKIPEYTHKGVKKKGKKHYTLALAWEGDCSWIFSLPRKIERCNIRKGKGTNWVITRVERIGKQECQCISIDSKDRMYVTDHCIPTHNSNCLVGMLLAMPPDANALVLANRKSLVDQNYDEIKKWGIKDVGRFYGDHKEIRTITCATVQSAHLLKKWLPSVKAVFVDEIHEMMSKKPKAVYNACKNASVRIGMSATPFKFGESDKVQKYEVKGYIGPVFLAANTETGRLSTKDLQARNILASAECTFYPVHEPELPYHVYIDAVTDGIAENNHFHEMTCKLVKSLKGRTLIIVERLAHGDTLHKMLPGSLWVRGEDDLETRKDVINRLKEDKGDLIAIASKGIFSVGINVFVANLVNCSGGAADHQIIQLFGRGLRVSEDKKHLKYYDWYFTNNDYLAKHSEKRVTILEREGHKVEIKESFDL